MIREILEFDPSWLSVYFELARRARTDPGFRKRLEDRESEVVLTNRARVEEAQRAGEIRDDLDARSLGIFVNLVLHGLMLQRAAGDEPWCSCSCRGESRSARHRSPASSPVCGSSSTSGSSARSLG